MTKKNKLILLAIVMVVSGFFAVHFFWKGHVNGPLMYASPETNPEYYWSKVLRPAAVFLICAVIFVWELRKK